ncbi:hypothetical protein [Mameliella sp.]|uniref:hypothetical protein n=1 Tax=Mameliella sp. TaxID=1924940 RepID=UPI003B5030DC
MSFRLSRQRARFAPGMMTAVLTLRRTRGRPRHEKLVQGDYCPDGFNPPLTICGTEAVIVGQDYDADCLGFFELQGADFETAKFLANLFSASRGAVMALRRSTRESH